MKLNLFPDTFSIIIQVENHDCDSDACSCQSLSTKATFTLYRNTKKNLTPKVHHQSLHIFFYLLTFAEQKEGRKTFTHIYDSSRQRQNKMIFERIFQTPHITPQSTEAKVEYFNLSSVCCLT